jgi:hypothetical protein
MQCTISCGYSPSSWTRPMSLWRPPKLEPEANRLLSPAAHARAKLGAVASYCTSRTVRRFYASARLGQAQEPPHSLELPGRNTLVEYHPSMRAVETFAIGSHGSHSYRRNKASRLPTKSSGTARLVCALERLILSKPVVPLSYLVNFHEEHAAQQSTRSYNILLRQSLYLSSYGTANRLRGHMHLRNIPPDAQTTQLTVRLLMRTGRWQDALQTCRSWSSSCSLPSHPSTFFIWLELLGYADRAAIEMPEKADDMANSPSSESEDKENSPSVMRSPPSHWVARVLAELEMIRPSRPEQRFSAQYIYMVALASIRNGSALQARRITKAWISSLPKTLTRKQRISCLNVIHLNLSYSPKTTNAHFKHRAFVDECLALNLCLRPNSTTVYLLLRSLQRSKSRAAIFAVQLVHAYVKRWGAGVVDRRVRRRVCSLAIKEGRMGIAKKWLIRQERAAFHDRRHTLAEDATGVYCALTKRSIPRPYSLLMPRRGRESRKWRWLKRRIWKRITRDQNQQIPPTL